MESSRALKVAEMGMTATMTLHGVGLIRGLDLPAGERGPCIELDRVFGPDRSRGGHRQEEARERDATRHEWLSDLRKHGSIPTLRARGDRR